MTAMYPFPLWERSDRPAMQGSTAVTTEERKALYRNEHKEVCHGCHRLYAPDHESGTSCNLFVCPACAADLAEQAAKMGGEYALEKRKLV